MKYMIKQKVFSLKDSFTIQNEMNQNCFKVTGKLLSVGKKLYLTDMQDHELFFIEQRLLKLMPEYKILENGKEVAQVKKNFTLFKPSFNITSVYGNFTIEGKFTAYDFKIFKEGKTVAEISKKFFSISDTYGISIADGENDAFLLTLVIVIDQVIHDAK